MPLTGEAKKEYQRKYMRGYYRKRKADGLWNYSRPHFRILERDGFRCQYCGSTPQDGVRLHVDHITPLCEGGAGTDDNLITACSTCNGTKGGKPLTPELEGEVKDGLRAKLGAVGLKVEGNEVSIGQAPVIPDDTPKPYNPNRQYAPGEQYIVGQGKHTITVTASEVDADGQPMPEYGF